MRKAMGFTLLLVLTLLACTGHRYPTQLVVADSLCAVNPDSALRILKLMEDTMPSAGKAEGAYHFDKYYGSGKKGYKKNDPNFFDKESYVTGDKSPYNNPRTGRDYGHAGNPLSGQKNSGADYLIPLLSILGFLAII